MVRTAAQIISERRKKLHIYRRNLIYPYIRKTAPAIGGVKPIDDEFVLAKLLKNMKVSENKEEILCKIVYNSYVNGKK